MSIKIIKDGKVHNVSLKGLLSMLLGRLLVEEPLHVEEFTVGKGQASQSSPRASEL